MRKARINRKTILVFLVITGLIVIGSLIERQWGSAVFIYFLGGRIMISHDKRIQKGDKPLYLANRVERVIIMIIWPFRLFSFFEEFLVSRNCPDRFWLMQKSSNTSLHEEDGNFRTMSDAVCFAKERKVNIFVYDTATKNMYTVSLTGDINKEKEYISYY